MKVQAASRAHVPFLVQAGVLATALLSLWGAFSYYDFESSAQGQSQNRDPYMIAAQAERFAALREQVPQNAVLGYLSDAEPGTMVASTIFGSAQYALAPRLVHASTSDEWVLGNFTRPVDFERVGAINGLRVERDFGNGVVLYRKQEP
jgi:hypothetical protein